MVTNIKEGKTKKCEQYWPEGGSGKSCGPFNTSLVEQHIFADYTIRTIQLVVSTINYNNNYDMIAHTFLLIFSILVRVVVLVK